MKSFAEKFQPLELPIHGVRLPTFQISNEARAKNEIPAAADNFQILQTLCQNGFKRLNFVEGTAEYQKYSDRVKYELSVIQELGFVDYILLVWHVINFCKEQSIPTGAGRGSAAGSCVLFLIGVTRIDPIKYDLYFERFISKTRAKKTIVNGVTYLDGSLMCDVDLDICFYNRQKVLAFLEKEFEGKTAKISTLNTLSGKLLIREIAKIVGEFSEDQANEVSDMLPKIHGNVRDIEEAKEGKYDADGKEIYAPVKAFQAWCEKHGEIYRIALRLRDLNKNKGVHASGVLLSYDPIQEACPLELSSDKALVSSFSMDFASLFNIKLDILGLRAVSVVDDVCKNIGIKPDDIDINDPLIYQNLFDLKAPHGLFQIEAETNFRVCQKVKPKNLEELSAVIALARPGSLSFVEDYAKYLNSGISADFDIDCPKLAKILNETGGVILYQETLMRILHEVFELSLEEAELARRACSKKKKKEMARFEELILDQGKKLNIPKSAAFFWQALLASADYSFNKCLSLDTQVETKDGFKMLYEIQKGDEVKAYDVENNRDHFVRVTDKVESEAELYEVELEDGRKITCSLKHKIMCEDKKMRTLEEIISQNRSMLCST